MARGRCQPADGGYLSVEDSQVGGIPGRPGSVYDVAVGDDEIEFRSRNGAEAKIRAQTQREKHGREATHLLWKHGGMMGPTRWASQTNARCPQPTATYCDLPGSYRR